MKFIKKMILKGIGGGAFGYCILHPLSMLIVQNHSFKLSLIRKYISNAFTLEHLGMALYFTLLGIIIGIAHACYLEKYFKIIHRFEVIQDLLPICRKCKNVRVKSNINNKKVEWISLAEYLSKSTKLNLEHGLCPKCVKKQLEELNTL